MKSIRQAINSANRAQRNYDLTKKISSEDLDLLIHSAKNSPSKQNETHYSIHTYTDFDKVYEIYENTKKFALIDDKLSTFGIDCNGKYWHDHSQSVTNSQILANALFVFVEEQGDARGGTHIVAQKLEKSHASKIYEEQINYSIGISVGQLILAASLLGYKTGICSAFDTKKVKNIINTDKKIKLLVGVGYSDVNRDRKEHPYVKNNQVPEKFRNGHNNDFWKFPSFKKQCKVYLNGSVYNK